MVRPTKAKKWKEVALIQEGSHLVSHASRHNGLDNHPSALATNDAKAQSTAIIDQVNDFQLTPLRAQLCVITLTNSKQPCTCFVHTLLLFLIYNGNTLYQFISIGPMVTANRNKTNNN
jgi:hypothetical protein